VFPHIICRHVDNRCFNDYVANFFIDAGSGAELYGINKVIHFIDLVIVVIGNTGLLVTGIIYATFTRRGWFRFQWINVKWFIPFAGMLVGMLFLGPWVTVMLEISKTEGLAALTNQEYQYDTKMTMLIGTIQLGIAIFALFIYTVKPLTIKKNSVALER